MASETEIEKCLEYLKNNKVVKKNLVKYSWLSGSNTMVSPITVDTLSKQIILQWASDKNVFNTFMNKVVRENTILTEAYFWKSDGSCPSHISFVYE